MKAEHIERDIQRSSSFEEKTMGLAVGSEAFVFNVLRKDLYSDPIGSLIREYTVNAQDEHRKHNKTDVPIAIQVPNRFSPELHIRDFAEGLTEEQVFNFFGNYGASDKRDSNLAVGFFGLGCKSAFAYTDSYIVKSYKDGMEYTFNIYIDETEIGKTAKISTEPTTEPNGVLIIVPVKTHDINTFQQKVLSTVQYFKTRPVITGMEETPNFDARTPIIAGEDWEFFGNGSPTVIMGEIPYPINFYKMGDNLENWESKLLRSDINIRVDIGDVQVTASREALQMSEKTIAAIRKKLAIIKDTMIAETEKAFAKAKNLIEAKTLWNTVVCNGGGYSDIIQSQGSITWKGENLVDNIIRFDRNLHSVTTYSYNRSKTMIQSDTSYHIPCKEGEVIHFDDTDKTKINYKRRARTLLDGGANRVTIIHTNDKSDLEDFLSMKVKELASLKAVTPTVATSNRVGGTGVDLSKRAKHTSKVFVLNLDKLKSYYGSASEVWDVKEVDNLKGIYVPIDRFKPVMNSIYDLNRLASALVHAERAGLDINIPIYGIKKGEDTTGLIRFDDWLDAKLKENKELLKNYSMSKAFTTYDLVDVSNLNVDTLPDNSVAKTYAVLYNTVKKLRSTASNNFTVFQYSRVDVEANKTIKEWSELFDCAYPMLKFVSSWQYNRPEIVNYILEKGE